MSQDAPTLNLMEPDQEGLSPFLLRMEIGRQEHILTSQPPIPPPATLVYMKGRGQLCFAPLRFPQPLYSLVPV